MSSTEVAVALDDLNTNLDDDKDKHPLLPISHNPNHVPSVRNNYAQNDTKKIFLVVAFYWICSMSVVFLNKYILTYAEYEFPFPLFVTWFQLVVAFVLLIICGFSRLKIFSLVPPFEFKLSIAIRVLPLTVVYVSMLAFNNLCLAFVEVSYYQVARSLTIIFNIVFTYFILKNKTSKAALLACSVVFLGFILGSYGESHFSYTGLFFGVCSSMFVALYGIYVKKKLPVVDNNEWRLLHYNTTMAIALLYPIVKMSGEFEEMHIVYFIDRPEFWVVMVITGVTGFLINIATFLQIKFTTPLTNTISGTAKACVQTVFSVILFQNPITLMNGFGIFLVLFGSGLYSFIRYKKI